MLPAGHVHLGAGRDDLAGIALADRVGEMPAEREHRVKAGQVEIRRESTEFTGGGDAV